MLAKILLVTEARKSYEGSEVGFEDVGIHGDSHLLRRAKNFLFLEGVLTGQKGGRRLKFTSRCGKQWIEAAWVWISGSDQAL